MNLPWGNIFNLHSQTMAGIRSLPAIGFPAAARISIFHAVLPLSPGYMLMNPHHLLGVTVHAFRAGFFILAAVLVLMLCGKTTLCAEAAPAYVQQYETAKRDMDRLAKDTRRGMWREPWEKLATTFLNLYEKNSHWVNRPAALFRSANAMEELGARSHQRQDSREALARYERLAKENTTNPLADDALYRAARLRAERLADIRGALTLLNKIATAYPRSDMAPAAAEYAKELTATLNVHSAGTATLNKASWSDSNGFVYITLTFDRPVAWNITSRPRDRKNGNPDRLIVELARTRPASTVRPGMRSSSSLLRTMRVDLTPTDAMRLFLDFKTLKRFTATTKTNPFRIIITASPTDRGLPRGLSMGSSFAAGQHLLQNLFTVMLDPGHGGMDPGTAHHGIVERDITLDLARRTGELLKARNIKVLYTRTDNTWIALDARSHLANQARADVFVSIHVNASPNEAASGFESYVFDLPSSLDAKALAGQEDASAGHHSKTKHAAAKASVAERKRRSADSRKLAGAIQREVMVRLKKGKFSTPDGGLKSAQFLVLVNTSMPSVLLEIGYCSNAEEAKRLATADYRTALAEGIAEGILTALQTLNELN